MILTKPQRQALRRIWLRTHSSSYVNGTSYRVFRKQALPGPGCIMVPFAGMWLGVEPDGYTHS